MATGQDGSIRIRHEGSRSTRFRRQRFRDILLKISEELNIQNFKKLKFLSSDLISKRSCEKARNAFDLFELLMENGALSPSNTRTLEKMLIKIDCRVLAKKLKNYCSSGTPIEVPMRDKTEKLIALLREEYKGRFAVLQPIPWNDELKLYLTEMYTRLEVKEVRRGAPVAGKDLKHLHAMFKTDENGTCARRIRIEGAPAMGKSILCRKLAHDWACGELKQYRLLFLLEMRHMQMSDVINEIFNQILPKDSNITTEELNRLILDNDVHNLFLFDGLDEIDENTIKNSEIPDHIDKKIRRHCTTIITTRPRLRDKFLSNCDLFLIVRGFTEQSSKEYIETYFKDDKDSGNAIEKEISEQKGTLTKSMITDLLSNPLHVSFLCILWEDYKLYRHNNHFPQTLTELYSEVLECTLRRYCTKYCIQLDDGKVPKDVIAKRDRLAFDSYQIYSDNRSTFQKTDMSSNESLYLGLLIRDLGQSRVKPRELYYFYHQTWLEYFSALYVSSQLAENNTSPLDNLFYKPGESISVLKFIAGNSNYEGCVQLFEMFYQKIEALKEEGYVLAYGEEPLSTLLNVCIECLYESAHSKSTISRVASAIGTSIVYRDDSLQNEKMRCTVECESPNHDFKFLQVDKARYDLKRILNVVKLLSGQLKHLSIYDPDTREMSLLAGTLTDTVKEVSLKSLEVVFSKDSECVSDLPNLIANEGELSRVKSLKVQLEGDTNYKRVSMTKLFASIAKNENIHDYSLSVKNLPPSYNTLACFEQFIDTGPTNVEFIMNADHSVKSDMHRFKQAPVKFGSLRKFIQTCKRTESLKLTFSEKYDAFLDYRELCPSNTSKHLKSFKLLLSEKTLRAYEEDLPTGSGSTRSTCVLFHLLSKNKTLKDISVGKFTLYSFHAACDFIKSNHHAISLSLYINHNCTKDIVKLMDSLKHNISLKHLTLKQYGYFNPLTSFEKCVLLLSREIETGQFSIRSITCCGKSLHKNKDKNVMTLISQQVRQHRWSYSVFPHCSGEYEHEIKYSM